MRILFSVLFWAACMGFLWGQGTMKGDSIPYAYDLSAHTISDTIPFFATDDEVLFANSDSTLLFIQPDDYSLGVHIYDQGKWTLCTFREVEIDNIEDVRYENVTHDSIPEIVFTYSFHQGVNAGGEDWRSLVILDHKNGRCLLDELVYMYRFQRNRHPETGESESDERTYELPIEVVQGQLSIESAKGNEAKFLASDFTPGTYAFENGKWMRIK